MERALWLRFWAEMTFGVGVGQQGKMRGGPGWQWEGRGMVLGLNPEQDR